MLRPAQRRLVLLTSAFALSLLSCGREVTGPDDGLQLGGRRAMLALAPELPSLMNVLEGAGDAVPFERVRILLRNEDGTVAKDTVVDFPATADSIALTLTLPIPTTAPDSGLPLALSMMYVNAAGDTVFRGGPAAIVARPIGSSGANVPVVIPVEFDGTGKDAASVVITPDVGTGVAGTTTAFAGTAFTAGSAPIPNTPFLFYTLDSARAQVNAATGVATWLPNRGTARIVAALPNGLRADTALFTVSLPASKLVLESGNAQTGSVLAPLTDSIVLLTLASDDVPVAGVIVQFAVASGGGNISVATDTSDALGRVVTRWTLGAALGAQSITATSAGLSGSPFTVTATAVASTPARLEFTAVPATGTAGAALAPALTVTARDAFGNVATSFTGNVTLAALGANPPSVGGTLTRPAVAGVATFADLVLTQALSVEFEATSGALIADTSAAITVGPAAAARLEFTQQPVGAVAGDNFLPPVSVTARDAFGNIATGFTGAVTLARLTGPAATLRGTVTQSAVAGVATFADLNIREAGTGFSLSASATGLVPDTSATFGITHSVPAQLVIVSGDAQTASVSSTLAQPLVVEVRDLYNNPVPAATVNFAAVSGGGSLIPTSALTDSLGRAQTSWTLGSALGAQQVDASLGAAPAVSVSFGATATVGAPAALVITAAPTSGTATTVLSNVIAQVRDALGNVVTTYNGAVDIAFATNPTGATLGGTLQRNAVAGVVTFNDLAITAAGAGYTLRATTVAEGIVSDTTASFNVVAGGAAQFFIFSGANQTGPAGAPFPQPLRVRVLDIHNNPLIGHQTTWNTGGVVTLTTVGTVLTDSLGIATNTAVFGAAVGAQSNGPFVSTVGSGSVIIFEHVVTPSTPDTLLLVSGNGQSGLPLSTTANPLEVEVRDASANPVPNVLVTFTITSGDANTTVSPVLTDANGRAATEVVFGTAAGPVTLRATVAGVADTVNFSLTLLPNAPSVIAPLVGPQNRNAGELLNTVTYELRDGFGNKATTFNGIARVQGRVPGLGAPLPNLIVSGDSVPVVNGDIAFDSLRVDSAGTYDLLVTVDGGPSGTFGPFTISPAGASVLLAVQGDGQTTPVTAPYTLPLRTRVTDAFGNGVAGVTVNFNTISGLATVPASANTNATGFAEVVVIADTLAGPIVVGAFAAGLTPDSVLFNLTAAPGAAAGITATAGDAQTVAAGDTAAVEVVVTVRDSWGNIVPGVNVSWGSADAVSFTVPAGVSDANGEVRTRVIAPGVLGARGFFADAGGGVIGLLTMTVEPGAANRVVITAAPTSASAGISFTPNVAVEVQDAFGNLVPTSTASVTLAVDSSATIAAINGTTTIAATAGVVSFESLSLNTAGEFRLVATSPGLLPDTSAAFTVGASVPTVMELVSGDSQVGTVAAALPAPMVVRLRDTFGNPVPGVPVTWGVNSGTAVLDSTSYVTDAAGLAQMSLTFANSVEVVEVLASYGSFTQTFTVAAVAAGATQLAMLIDPSAGTAGAAIAPLAVEARDPYLNTATSFVGGVTVSVDSGPSGAVLGGTTTATAVAGIATFTDLTLDLAGTYRLRFQSPGLADTVSATFTIDAAAPTLLALIAGDAQTDTVLALTDTLLVRVTDGFGNGVAGASVVWAVAAGNAAFAFQQNEADSLGYARAVVAFGATPGVVEITATHAALPPATFTLNAVAGNATQLSIFSAPSSVASPGTGAVIEVEVRDAHGNRALAYAGTISLGLESSPPGSSLGGVTASGVVDGIATFDAITLDLIGSYTIRASGAGLTPADAIITVTPGAPANLAVSSGDNQSAFATLALDAPLTVRLTDAVGNPIVGDSVFFVVATGSGTFSNGFATDTSLTDANGYAAASYTAGATAGVETIEASAAALPTVTFTVNVAELLGNAIWTGDASTLWTNPGNWRGGLIPTLSDSVYFPAGRPGYPSLEQSYSIGKLTVADGVTGFALSSFDLIVAGDIHVPTTAAFTTIGGAVVGSGSGTHSLRGTLPALALENGVYEATPTGLDAVTVLGALIVRQSARLALDGTDSVVVGGTFSTQTGGTLSQVPGTVLEVAGDINFAGGSTAGLLDGGRIRAGGNFSALGGSTQSFAADSSHVVELLGAITSVNLGSPDLSSGTACSAMCFGRLVADSLMGVDSVTFLSGAKAVGGFDFELPRFDAEGRHLVSIASSVVRGDYTRISRYTFVDGFDQGPSFVVDTLVAAGTGVLPSGATVPLIVTGTREMQFPWYSSVTVDGTLDIGSGIARVLGVLRTRGSGRLQMTDASDTLAVDTAATFDGSTVAGLLSAGTLLLYGDFSVTGATSYIADSTHRLVFSDAITFTPTLSVVTPGTNPLGTLVVTGGTTLTVASPGITLLGDVIIGPAATVVASGAPYTVPVRGFFIDSTGGRWQVAETVLQGTNAIQTTSFANEVYIAGPSQLNAPLSTLGTLRVSGAFGELDLNGHSLTVAGNFITQTGGRLVMDGATDSLVVSGNAAFTGGVSTLSAGTFVLSGIFDQNSGESFRGGPEFVTELVGATPQQIGFSNPGFGPGQSHFGRLRLAKSAGNVNVSTVVPVNGRLETADDAQILAGVGQLSEMIVRGADLFSLELVNQPLVIVAGDSIVALDSLRWTSMDAGLTQLTLARDGGSFTINTPVFDSVATTPTYLALEETLPNADTLQVTVLQPAPLYHFGRINLQAGARLFGWDSFEFVEWTNAAADGDWHNPANWNVGAVPSAADSVVVPAAVPTPPTTSVYTEVRALVSQNALPVVVNDVFVVRNALRLPFGPVGISCGVNGRVHTLASYSDSVSVNGELDCGLYPRLGRVALSEDLIVDSLVADSLGSVTVRTYDLIVNGPMRITGSGATLAMPEASSYLSVAGTAEFGGAVTSSLADGTLILRGDFAQFGSATAFQAAPAHRTVFAGNANQTITFANPAADGSGSQFGTLDIQQTEAGVHVQLDSDVFANGQLIANDGTTRVLLAGGGDRLLETRGASVGEAGSLTLQGVRWRLTEGANVSTNLYNVTFAAMPASATQFAIARSGGSHTLNSFVFDSSATTPVYLQVEDLDGAVPEVLSISMIDPAPLFHFGRIVTIGVGEILGWVDEPSFIWISTSSNDWTDPANWSDNVVPTPTAAVEIPETGAVPIVPPGTTIASLDLSATSSALSLDGVFTVNGSIIAPLGLERGLACGTGDRVVMNAQGGSVNVRGTIGCLLEVVNGIVQAGGETEIDSLQVSATGAFDSHADNVTISGELRVDDGGALQMTNIGNLTVSGPALFASAENDSTTMIAGTLTLQRGFTATRPGAIRASVGHVTVVGGCGLAGCAVVTVPDTASVSFGGLEFEDSNGNIEYEGALDAGIITLRDNVFLALKDGDPYAALRSRGDVNGSDLTGLTASALWVGGTLALNGTFTVDTTVFNGTGQLIPARNANATLYPYLHLRNLGTSTLDIADGDSLTVSGLFLADSGSVAVGLAGRTTLLAVSGQLLTQGTGTIEQAVATSTVRAAGAFFFGGSTDGLLTDGTLLLTGTLQQGAAGSTSSFRPTGSHTTRFRLDGVITPIVFQSAGNTSTTSGFAKLAFEGLQADDTLRLHSDVFVADSLIDAADNLFSFFSDGPQRLLSARTGALSTIRYNAVNLQLRNVDEDISLSDLIFEAQDVTVHQADLSGPGGVVVTASNFTFANTPSGGGSYVRVNGTGGGTFAFTATNFAPTIHSGNVQIVGDAVLSGWDDFGPNIWLGTVDSDWDNAANWFEGRIAVAGDSLVLSETSANPLIADGIRSVGAIRTEAGHAGLQITDTLVINRYLYASHGPVSCSPGAAIRHQNTEVLPQLTRIVAPTCNFHVVSGTSDLQNVTQEYNDITVVGDGVLRIAGQTVNVAGNVTTSDNARIEFSSDFAVLNVSGNVALGGGSGNAGFNAGRLTVLGDFTVDGVNAAIYDPDGTHRLVLGDSANPTPPSATINVTQNTSHARQLELYAPRSVVGEFIVRGEMRARRDALSGGRVQVDSGLVIGPDASILNHTMSLAGTFVDSGTFLVDTAEFRGRLDGSPQIVPARNQAFAVIPYSVLRVADGEVHMLTAGGYQVDSAIIVTNTGWLTVGDPNPMSETTVLVNADSAILTVQGEGSLSMAGNTTLSVKDAIFAGASSTGRLVAGTLEVNRNLIALEGGDGALDTFYGSGSHRVVMADSGRIQFANPTLTPFNRLALNAGAQIELASDIVVIGEFTRNSGPAGAIDIRADVISTVPPRRITASGGASFPIGFGRQILHNVQLAFVDDVLSSRVYEFSNFTFTDMDPAATYLDLTGLTGYTISADSMQFATVPSTGRYFDLVSGTVNFPNATPGEGCLGAPEGCVGPRYEPQLAQVNNWIATVPGLPWSDQDNWSLNRVPLSYDDVTILGSFAPYIDAGSPRRARNLTVAAGLDIFADPGAELEISGNLTLPLGSNIFGDNDLSIVRVRPASGIPVTIGGGGSIDDVQVFISPPNGGGDSTVTLVAGGIEIGGRLEIEGGRLDIGGQTLEADSLHTSGSGRLSMLNPADSVYVISDARFEGASTFELLIDGKFVMESGSFFASGAAFNATNSHVTRLINLGGTSLEFANAGTGPSDSHFNRLEVSRSAGVVSLVSDVYALAEVVVNDSVTFDAVGVANRALSAGGWSHPGGLVFPTFDNVRLDIRETHPVSFGSVMTFNNMDVSVFQLRVSRLGGTITIPAAVFTPLTSGDAGFYLIAEDLDGGVNGTLDVQVGAMTPAGHDGFISSIGGATITGWDQFSIYNWEGLASSDPADPLNWVQQVAPTAVSVVQVGTGTGSPFVASSPLTYRNLTFLPSSGATVSAPITVSGILSLGDGPSCSPTGEFITGNGGLFSGDASSCRVRVPSGAATQSSGFVTLSTLIADGNFVVGSNAGSEERITLLDSLHVAATGSVIVQSSIDTVTVEGLSRLNGPINASGTAARLNLFGDLIVGGSFDAANAHFYLGNPDVPTAQTVRFTDQTGAIDSLSVINSAVTIQDSLKVRRLFAMNDLYPSSVLSHAGGGVLILGDSAAGVDGNMNTGDGNDVLVDRLAVFGSLGAFASLAADTVDFLGISTASQQIPGAGFTGANINYGVVRVYGNAGMSDQKGLGDPAYEISGGLYILGNGLVQFDGSLGPDSTIIQIGGNGLEVNGIGARFDMNGSLLRVATNDIHLEGEGTSIGYGGVLEVNGNVTVVPTGVMQALFNADAYNHTTRILGSGTIDLGDTGGNTSFGGLEIAAGDVHTLLSNVTAGQLRRVPGSIGTLELRADNLTWGNTRGLVLEGVSLDGADGELILRNVALALRKDLDFGSPVFDLENVTFTEMDPTITQLILDFGGTGALTFSDINFSTGVTTGQFLAFVNSFGHGAPTVTFVNPSPSLDCFAEAPCIPGSLVPDGAPEFTTWEGNTDSDWNNPTNWLMGQVPTQTTSVVIPLTGNQPIISQNSYAADVTVEAGATLTINPSDTLDVYGDLDVQGTITGSSHTGAVRMRAGGVNNSLTAPGSIALPLVIDGQPGPISGMVTASGVVNLDTLPTGTDGWLHGLWARLGTFNVDGATIRSLGGLRFLDFARLQMSTPTDSVDVLHNIVFSGGPTEGLLTDGVIVARYGGFFVNNNTTPTAFHATGNHRTILTGAADSTLVGFDASGAASSKFAQLVINKPGSAVGIVSDSVYADALIHDAGTLVVYNDRKLVVTGTISSFTADSIILGSIGSSVRVEGVDPQTCDFVTVSVSRYSGQFEPSSCHTPPLNWVQQTTATAENLNAVHSVDATTHYAVGDNGAIQFSGQTVGAGGSWTSVSIGGSDNLYDVHSFVDGSTPYVIAVGANGRIIQSVASAAFAPMTSGTAETLRGVYVISADSAVAVGDNGTVLLYDGVSWASQTSGTVEDLLAIGRSGDTLFVTGTTGTLRYSTNSGVTWTGVASNTAVALHAFYAASATSRTLGGSVGTIVQRSELSTLPQSVSPLSIEEDIYGLGGIGSYALAVGSNGTVLQRQDRSWTSVNSPGLLNLRGASVYHNSTNNQYFGLVVGDGGAIYYSLIVDLP